MESKDTVARLLSVLSIIAAGATAFYSWSVSPYFYAQPTAMNYFYHGGNTLTKENKPKDSYMDVSVYNGSSRPARNVTVVLYPIGRDFDIDCNAMITKQVGRNGSVVLTIDRIAPRGQVVIREVSHVDQFPDSPRNGYKHGYIGSVGTVETEFGQVPRHNTSYVNYPHAIQPLPGDIRAKDWNPEDG